MTTFPYRPNSKILSHLFNSSSVSLKVEPATVNTLVINSVRYHGDHNDTLSKKFKFCNGFAKQQGAKKIKRKGSVDKETFHVI